MAEGLMVGTCLGPDICLATGREAELALGPTMAWMPTMSTSSRTLSRATSGSLVASIAKPSTGCPRMPPAWFRCLMARSKAFWRAWEASGESVKFRTRPIFRRSWVWGGSASSAHPKMRLTAARARSRVVMVLVRVGNISFTGEGIRDDDSGKGMGLSMVGGVR